MSNTGHKHTDSMIVDSTTDAHFIIDIETGVITKSDNKKLTLVQYDHNSERYTFEIDRTIEGHDIIDCNRVQVHFLNISSTGRGKIIGLYPVEDLHIHPQDNKKACFTWLISDSATQNEGLLTFMISFQCVEGEGEDVKVLYRWNSAINNTIRILPGLDNNNAAYEAYADELLKWEYYIEAHLDEIEKELQNTIIPGMVDNAYIKIVFASSEEVADIFALSVDDIDNATGIVQTTGQSTKNVMSQKAVTDEINNIWATINYVAPAISTFTLTPSASSHKLPATYTLTSITHKETNIANISGTLTLKRGSTVLKSGIAPSSAGATITVSDTVTLTSSGVSYTLSGTDKNGKAISKTVYVSAYYTSYIGASTSETISDTLIASLTDVSSSSLSGTRSVEISGESKYVWLVTTSTINSITSGGFEVPYNAAVTYTHNGTTYKCYRTSSKIVAGSNSFVIA